VNCITEFFKGIFRFILLSRLDKENEFLRDELKFYFIQLESTLKTSSEFQQMLRIESQKSNEIQTKYDILKKENLNLKLKIAGLCCSLTENELKMLKKSNSFYNTNNLKDEIIVVKEQQKEFEVPLKKKETKKLFGFLNKKNTNIIQ
jgi:hypothetical protein